MRKITEDAFRAFTRGEKFSRDNTAVTTEWDDEGGCLNVKMYLHGNLIAKWRRWGDFALVSVCGFPTNVTKERLSPFARVNVRNGKLYLNAVEWDGEFAAVPM